MNHPDTEQASVLPAWVSQVLDAWQSIGVDTRSIRSDTLPPLHQDDARQHRIAAPALNEAWERLQDVTADSTPAWHIGSSLKLTSLGVLHAALANSSSPSDLCRRLQRFIPLLHTGLHLTAEANAETSELTLLSTAADRDRNGTATEVELLLVSMARELRDAAGSKLPDMEIRLRRPASDADDRLQNQADPPCPIRFGTTTNCIISSACHWHAPLPLDAAEGLDAFDEQLLETYLHHLETDPLTTRVRGEILNLLPAGEPDVAQVASIIGSSTRTLQRRLAAANTSFSGMVTRARQELANNYLHESDFSLREIGLLLGFSDQANFSRAFKSWYGIAPGQYRRQLDSRRRTLAA